MPLSWVKPELPRHSSWATVGWGGGIMEVTRPVEMERPEEEELGTPTEAMGSQTEPIGLQQPPDYGWGTAGSRTMDGFCDLPP